MTPKNIREMEPHIKQRYWFALSSFSRMYGVKSASSDVHIRQFCLEWSEWVVNAPLTGLDEVDQYFYYEYKNWRGR
jgi:predicted nucleotidyltransferase